MPTGITNVNQMPGCNTDFPVADIHDLALVLLTYIISYSPGNYVYLQQKLVHRVKVFDLLGIPVDDISDEFGIPVGDINVDWNVGLFDLDVMIAVMVLQLDQEVACPPVLQSGWKFPKLYGSNLVELTQNYHLATITQFDWTPSSQHRGLYPGGGFLVQRNLYYEATEAAAITEGETVIDEMSYPPEVTVEVNGDSGINVSGGCPSPRDGSAKVGATHTRTVVNHPDGTYDIIYRIFIDPGSLPYVIENTALLGWPFGGDWEITAAIPGQPRWTWEKINAPDFYVPAHDPDFPGWPCCTPLAMYGGFVFSGLPNLETVDVTYGLTREWSETVTGIGDTTDPLQGNERPYARGGPVELPGVMTGAGGNPYVRPIRPGNLGLPGGIGMPSMVGSRLFHMLAKTHYGFSLGKINGDGAKVNGEDLKIYPGPHFGSGGGD